MLVTMKEIVDKANEENYAVAAPNIMSEFDARAYIEVAEKLNAPLILDVDYNAHADLMFLGKVLRDLAIASSVPIAINLDHGNERHEILEALQAGFTSVMVDRSSESFDVNVRDVKEIVGIAHAIGVTVEAELGHVGDGASVSSDRDKGLTAVEEAVEYIELTNVDCLAVAVGTAHGAYPEGYKPYLDFERLTQIKEATNGFPLVLHGSSGLDIESLRKACQLGINKVNISYDLAKAAIDAVEAADLEGSNAYNFYNIAKKGSQAKLEEMIKVYGSENKAWQPENKGLIIKDTTMIE